MEKPEEKIEEVQEIEEPQEEIKDEIKEDEVKEEEKEEIKEEIEDDGIDHPPAGILDKIANVFKRKPEEKEEVEEETEKEVEETPPQSTETEEETGYVQINQKFVDAAQSYGWTDQQIIEYAEDHSDIDIVTMTGLMGEPSQTLPKKETPEKGFYDEEALSKLAEEDETVKAVLDKLAKPLAKRLADVSSELEGLKTGLETQETSRKAKQEIRNMEIANEVFDAAKISSLGKTKDIPKYPDGSLDLRDPIVQERQKIWEMAQLLHTKEGSFKSAMDNAIQWYKGGNAEQDMEKKVIGKLKKQEKKVFPQRTNQKVAKTYTNEEERKADIINEALAKYNVELPTS